MSDPAIRVEGLGKRYRLGRRERYLSLRDSLARAAGRPVRWLRKAAIGDDRTPDLFWALKDVSFDVDHGEVVGIIGRNGAGKSTLLKILSRITEPTAGRVELNGRVGSLLEVGTGFHPELTGRENIFLNGAILGMKREEIARKFDEIVAFAEVERFLDMPVKHYSTGMYTRLAFAVAAHLEPEILVVDEVLAVGDAQFQKKCLGKMGDVAKTGRTVLFVSHNMAAVRLMCGRGLLLAQGKIVDFGAIDRVVDTYEATDLGNENRRVWDESTAPGGKRVKILAVEIRKAAESDTGVGLTRSSPLDVEIRFVVREASLRLHPHVHLFSRGGPLLFISNNFHDPELGNRVYPPGTYTVVCRIPGKLLNTGHYDISVYLTHDFSHWEATALDVVSFELLEDGTDRGVYVGGWAGLIRPVLDWRLIHEERASDRGEVSPSE
jgi:lipopolysaccharide transport system ATP-binding protein